MVCIYIYTYICIHVHILYTYVYMHVWDPNPNRSKTQTQFLRVVSQGFPHSRPWTLRHDSSPHEGCERWQKWARYQAGSPPLVGLKWSPFWFHGDLFAGHLWTRTSFGPSTMCRYGRRGTEGGSSNCAQQNLLRLVFGPMCAILKPVAGPPAQRNDGKKTRWRYSFFRARAFLDFQHVSARCGTTAWMRSRPTFVTTSYYNIVSHLIAGKIIPVVTVAQVGVPGTSQRCTLQRRKIPEVHPQIL